MYPASSVYICIYIQRNVTITIKEEIMNLEGRHGVKLERRGERKWCKDTTHYEILKKMFKNPI